ncbi:hypothetical protein Tco_1053008 [Tanacetum coccineum]
MCAKQFHIRRQKEKRDKPKEVYSDSKIIEVIKTLYELGHEHKIITEIIVRRANEKIDLIIKPDYKYFNKNDIEDLYLLCINGKLGMESYQQKVIPTAPTITFLGIKRKKLFSITSEPVVEKLKKYNKDVKYGYIDPSPSDVDVEYLRFYKEYIEDHLKH